MISAFTLWVEHDLIQIGLLCLREVTWTQLGLLLISTVSTENFKLDILEGGCLYLLFESADLSARPQFHIKSLPRDEVLLVGTAD